MAFNANHAAVTLPARYATPDMESTTWTTVLEIVADTLGMPIEDLRDDDIGFDRLGLDTLVAPAILGKILEATRLKLAEDVFRTFPTPRKLLDHITELSIGYLVKTEHEECSLVVLLHGDPKTSTKNLFLFPDGSGSPMVYSHIPAVGTEYCVYALCSPFLRNPESYTCSVEHLAQKWARCIIQVQEHGPYILGGWSAGGYYAYEAVKYLHRIGKAVESLILVDSPCLTKFEPLSAELVQHLSSKGVLGGNNSRSDRLLLRHFESTLLAIEMYSPQSMDILSSITDVCLIWASDPLLDGVSDLPNRLNQTSNISRFLLQQRTDFGANGWDQLFPGAVLYIAITAGDHFSLVNPPNVMQPRGITHVAVADAKQASNLGKLIGEAVRGRRQGWQTA